MVSSGVGHVIVGVAFSIVIETVAVAPSSLGEAELEGVEADVDEPAVPETAPVNGAGNSRVFELRAPMMVRNRYGEATMKCSVWQKDMDVIGAFANNSLLWSLAAVSITVRFIDHALPGARYDWPLRGRRILISRIGAS